MVSAMGPLGVEGVFRKSCACTLRVLRTNANTLMSIVTPFVYDPLVSWPRNVPPLQNIHNAEKTNEQVRSSFIFGYIDCGIYYERYLNFFNFISPNALLLWFIYNHRILFKIFY